MGRAGLLAQVSPPRHLPRRKKHVLSVGQSALLVHSLLQEETLVLQKKPSPHSSSVRQVVAVVAQPSPKTSKLPSRNRPTSGQRKKKDRMVWFPRGRKGETSRDRPRQGITGREKKSSAGVHL